MNSGEYNYIWQDTDWPNWRYDLAKLAVLLADVSRAQGLLAGRLADIGMGVRDQINLTALAQDVVKTSEIEGEFLDLRLVRSSIARRLSVDIGALAPIDRHIEGVVEMVLDATTQYEEPLSKKRLFRWHTSLFQTERNNLSTINIGAWRDDCAGPMQVVSGPVERRRIHFQAPPADCLDVEASAFFKWANAPTPEPLIIKAGLAHLWFVTMHPFDDGNGRIARAIGDVFLARADANPQRFYSLAAQIELERKTYYDILESTQKGSLDVTQWLMWFLGALYRAVISAHNTLDAVFAKTQFWRRWAGTPLNVRQVKLLNRLLDGFDGKLTSSKWAAIAKCSQDTALRDINEMLAIGILVKLTSGGRSTSYEITHLQVSELNTPIP